MHLVDQAGNIARRHGVVADIGGDDLRGQFDVVSAAGVSLIETAPITLRPSAGKISSTAPAIEQVSRSTTIFKNYYLTSQPARKTKPPNATDIGKMTVTRKTRKNRRERRCDGPANTTNSLQGDCATRGSRQNAACLAAVRLRSIHRHKAYSPSRRRRRISGPRPCAASVLLPRFASRDIGLTFAWSAARARRALSGFASAGHIASKFCGMRGSRRVAIGAGMGAGGDRQRPHRFAFFARAREPQGGRPNADRSLAGGFTAGAAGRGGDSEISSSRRLRNVRIAQRRRASLSEFVVERIGCGLGQRIERDRRWPRPGMAAGLEPAPGVAVHLRSRVPRVPAAVRPGSGMAIVSATVAIARRPRQSDDDQAADTGGRSGAR